jgi:DEAD/DEAH box helicase domain-containing protein
MPLRYLVTNEQPKAAKDVPEALLSLFQAYTRCTDGHSHAPFEHQAEVFRRACEDEEVFLAAGTASGKTLAIAVPLFHKLVTRRVRKVLLMYPTIALMDDQRRVMDTLAGLTGLEVAQIQGGMSRTKLIQALNKPVILATPDEVYWFFRKNVKYSGLLIYSLALVDEFVLDEAHLFNGLMLRNFEHLWRRVQALARDMGKSPRLHILTATPTEALKRLSGAQEIRGRSKCDDVRVEFRPSGRFDRGEHVVRAVNEVLASGQRKVLVVCNSARMTHQLFESYKVNDASTIPVEHRLKFGKVTLGPLIKWLEKSAVEPGLIDALSKRLLREEDILLDDVPDGTAINLPLQDVVTHAAEVLDRQCWRVKRALWEKSQHTGDTWESLLNNRPLPCLIIAALRKQLESASNVDGQQAIVDEWLTNTIEQLGNISQDPIPCKASEFVALTEEFTGAGVAGQLATLLTKRLKFDMKADPAQIPARSLSHRPVYLRWLNWAAGEENAHKLGEAVRTGLESGELEAECRHVGLWKGTDVPVIVYSGSMSKQAREGLIDVFADLESAVLVSTSAVEVGVDFHADALITEECEGNSFLQRFGRVGRHGKDSQVITFVSGDAYSALDADQTSIGRQDFSAKIVKVFAPRNYASGSQWLDASHYLVNQQLGRIGERLNSAIPDLAKAKPMAEELRSAQVKLSFGLRGTMPQITLRDGVTKDPFYLLRYVDDDDLRPADSPFEVARAQKWFTSLIFQSAQFDVIVDLDRTLEASEHLFILHRGQLKSFHERGIGLRHLSKLMENVEWNRSQPLYFLLLQGDVYVSRLERGTPTPEPVRDSEQNPLFIPNQTYLVLWGWRGAEETHDLLEGARIANWEELYYDEDRLKQDWNQAMVILERMTGACFAAYKELVEYAGSQIQR